MRRGEDEGLGFEVMKWGLNRLKMLTFLVLESRKKIVDNFMLFLLLSTYVKNDH